MNIFKKYPIYKYILIIFDYGALAVSFFIALKVRFWPKIDLINNPDYFIHPLYWTLLGYAVICIIIFQYYNLYKKHIFITIVQQQVLILKAIAVAIIGLIIISFTVKYPKYVIDSRLVIAYSAIGSLILVSFFRIMVFRNLFLLFAKNELIRRRVLIVGSGKNGKMVAADMISDKKYGYNLVGFVDDNLEPGTKVFSSYIVLGNLNEINDIVKIYDIHEIIICLESVSYERLLEVAEICNNTGKLVQVYSDLYEIIAQKVPVEQFSRFPLVRMGHFYDEGINYIFKRFIDIIGSLLGIIIFSPVFAAIAIAIKIDSPGPILFKQKRLGRNGKLFDFYKFRSMYVNVDDSIHREYLKELIKKGRQARDGGQNGVYKLVKDPRITKVGAFIRKWSLDELPQFFNVLKGDMSLVGPRPALPYEYEEYSEWHKQRTKVLPGITGLWQVSGRNQITFDDMVVLDIYYIENMSPWFDLQIILKTIPVVFFKKSGY